MRLVDLSRQQAASLSWIAQPDPVLGPPFPSPVIADPTFLPPESTPAGDWRLWAHSLLGLHAYRSDDGLSWDAVATVTRNALRAQAVVHEGFILAYEKTRSFIPFGIPWSSRIEARRSADLERWSSPVTLLAPSRPWHVRGRSAAVSNPCLMRLPDGRWRLYYSAGLTRLPDCGFDEPTFIGVAHGPGPLGPFVVDPQPLLGPQDGPASLAAGAIKVLQVADGWIGFQNAITWDGEHSGSEIWLLGSKDGLAWDVLGPVLAPTGRGWMATHIYALDVRDTTDGPRMYFNARDGYHWLRGRERIGVAFPTA